MYGISGPWFAFIMIAAVALGIMGFLLIDTWRLDARARRNREKAAAEPQPEK
jgi:hypothetical protein